MPKDTSDHSAPKHDIDSVFHNAISRFTWGLSPTALATACVDWWMHLLGSPTRQAELLGHAMTNAVKAMDATAPADPADKRFQSAEWTRPPFSYYRHWFSLAEDWWKHATDPIEGVDPAHQRMVAFMGWMGMK